MSTLSLPREQYVVNAKGKKTGVILSLKRYQQLMEDLHDLALVAERRDEEPISLNAVKTSEVSGRSFTGAEYAAFTVKFCRARATRPRRSRRLLN